MSRCPDWNWFLSNIPHFHNSWALESEGSPPLPESSPPNSTAQAALGQMEILHIGEVVCEIGPSWLPRANRKVQMWPDFHGKKIRCFSDVFPIFFGSVSDLISIRLGSDFKKEIRFGSDSDPNHPILIRFGSESSDFDPIRIRFKKQDPIRIRFGSDSDLLAV